MTLKIKTAYGRTINLGNFESVRIDASITEQIDNKNKRDYQDILADLFDECEHFVLKNAK